MATYDKNQEIIASNTDFEDLRKKLYNDLINLSTRKNTVGKHGWQKYSPPSPNIVSNSISAKEQNTNIITQNPFAYGINVIYDILQHNYMKVGTYTNEKQRILNLGSQDQYDIIPALTDYFTIVNYWTTNTSESNTLCNGACTGYCSGMCYDTCAGCTGTNSGITGTSQGCSGTCSGSAGYGTMSPDTTDCVTCWFQCTAGCGNSCSGYCGGGCKGCSNTCGSECRGTCMYSCGAGCKDKCGSDCAGSCMFGASANP